MSIKSEKSILRKRCDAEWQSSPRLRQEFGNDFEAFVAYTTAKGKGLIGESIVNRVVTSGDARCRSNIITYQS